MSAPAPGEPKRTPDDGGSPTAAVVGRSRRSALWRASVASAVAGVVAAVVGTALHAHVWHVGSMNVPVGALGAIVFSMSLAVLMALWARTVIVAAATGSVAYALVGLLAAGPSPSLIVTGIQVGGNTPGVAVAGYIWVIGLAVGTVAAVAVSWLVLRSADREFQRAV